MGQCGCADGFGAFSFPGPDGTVYTFDTYAGCRGCETPIGITLQAFRGETLQTLQDDGLPPPLPWIDADSEYSMFPLSLIDPTSLAKDIVAALGDLTMEDGDGGSWKLSDLFEVEPEQLRDAIEKNMRRTVDEWLKERAG